jgi:hypothetical protein
MLSEMTNSSDHEVASHQEWRMSSADFWLRLAAAPTFAIMALLTAVLGGGAPDMLCSAVHHASPRASRRVLCEPGDLALDEIAVDPLATDQHLRRPILTDLS